MYGTDALTPLAAVPLVRVPVIVVPTQLSVVIVPVATSVPHVSLQPLPMKKFKQFVVVLNMTKPKAGFTIALRCVVVMRGGRNPWVVEFISVIAVAFGVLVPIPMLDPLL